MNAQGEGMASALCPKEGLREEVPGRWMAEQRHSEQPCGNGKGGEGRARSTSLPRSLALLCHFSFQGGGERGSGAQRWVLRHKMIKTTEVFISFPVTVDVTAIAIFWDKLFISGFSSFISCSQRKNWWGVVIIYITAGDGDFNSDIQNWCIVLFYRRYMW